jgi:hypothetical protein
MIMTDHHTNQRRASASPVELAFPGAVDDGFVWMPADGDDHFEADPGEDTLYLPTLDAARLRSAILLRDHRLMLRIGSDGFVRFLDTEGLPRAAEGMVRAGGACLTFRAVRAIQLG